MKKGNENRIVRKVVEKESERGEMRIVMTKVCGDSKGKVVKKMKKVIALMTAILFVLGISAVSFAADATKPEAAATKAADDKAAATKKTADDKKAAEEKPAVKK